MTKSIDEIKCDFFTKKNMEFKVVTKESYNQHGEFVSYHVRLVKCSGLGRRADAFIGEHVVYACNVLDKEEALKIHRRCISDTKDVIKKHRKRCEKSYQYCKLMIRLKHRYRMAKSILMTI